MTEDNNTKGAATNEGTKDKGPSQEEYERARQHQIGHMTDQWTQHDKAILTIAAGVAGLSIVFVNTILPTTSPTCVWLLFGAWILLIAVIFLIVSSMSDSAKAAYTMLNNLDQNWEKKGEIDSGIVPNQPWVNCSNRFAGNLFVAALIMMATFVGVNMEMPKENETMANKDSSSDSGSVGNKGTPVFVKESAPAVGAAKQHQTTSVRNAAPATAAPAQKPTTSENTEGGSGDNGSTGGGSPDSSGGGK